MPRPQVKYEIRAQDKTAEGLSKVRKSLSTVSNSFKTLLPVSTVTAFAGLTATLASGVRELDEYNRKLLQASQLLKQTETASGLTTSELEGFAAGLARTTLASEQGILSAANQLLTFKSIAGETFTETLTLAQDLAATGFGSIQSATLTLAKALEDPVARLGELSRVGITVSESQRDLVKDLVATGQKAEAQGIILRALRDQIGGAGAAEADGTLAGAVDSLGQSWRELKRELAEGGAFNAAVGFVNTLKDGVEAANRFFTTAGKIERLQASIAKERRRQDESILQFGFVREERARRIADAEAEINLLMSEQFAEGQKLLAQKNEAVAASQAYQESIRAETEVSTARNLANEIYSAQLAANAEGQKRYAEVMAEGARVTREFQTPLETLSDRLVYLQELLDKGAISWETYSRAVFDAQEAAEKASQGTEKATEKTETAMDKLKKDSESAANALKGVFSDADRAIKQFAESILQSILEIALQSAISGIFGVKGGGDLFGSIFGSIFGRATGGPVTSGQPYVVGENGPELFVPNTSGNIEPNDSGNKVDVNFNLYAMDTQTGVEFLLQNRNVIVNIMRGAYARAGKQVELA